MSNLNAVVDSIKFDTYDESHWKDVLNVIDDVYEKTGYKFKVADDPEGCQDGSLLGYLSLNAKLDRFEDSFVRVPICDIFFSKYGKLAYLMIHLEKFSLERVLSDVYLLQIKSFIEMKGFRLVDTDEVMSYYKGERNEFSGMIYRDILFSN